jgi:hypothetical protein
LDVKVLCGKRSFSGVSLLPGLNGYDFLLPLDASIPESDSGNREYELLQALHSVEGEGLGDLG